MNRQKQRTVIDPLD